MNATILCIGKLKEKWQQDGCSEYLKRLSRYGKYDIRQLDDLREPENASPLQIRQILEKEGKSILAAIHPNDHVIAMCIRADAPDSPGLAEKMRVWAQNGKHIVFVIGGSNGLSDAVIERANEKLSFSKLTFPHGLMRVILLEQLYRGEKILAGEKYHK